MKRQERLLKTRGHKDEYRKLNLGATVNAQSRVVKKTIGKEKSRVRTLHGILKQQKFSNDVERHACTQRLLLESLQEILEIIPEAGSPTQTQTKEVVKGLTRLRAHVVRAKKLSGSIYEDLRKIKDELDNQRDLLNSHMMTKRDDMRRLATCAGALRNAPEYNAIAPFARGEIQFKKRKESSKQV